MQPPPSVDSTSEKPTGTANNNINFSLDRCVCVRRASLNARVTNFAIHEALMTRLCALFRALRGSIVVCNIERTERQRTFATLVQHARLSRGKRALEIDLALRQKSLTTCSRPLEAGDREVRIRSILREKEQHVHADTHTHTHSKYSLSLHDPRLSSSRSLSLPFLLLFTEICSASLSRSSLCHTRAFTLGPVLYLRSFLVPLRETIFFLSARSKLSANVLDGRSPSDGAERSVCCCTPCVGALVRISRSFSLRDFSSLSFSEMRAASHE